MKHSLHILLLFAILSGINSRIVAQNATPENKVKIELGADLYSRYVWRGTQYGGNSPSLQPSLSASYGNFVINAWGAYSLGGINPSQEMDLSLSYSFLNDLFTAVITDYYFPTEDAPYNYFNYSKNSTGHVLELGVSFNGTKEIPLSFSAYVNFFGADAVRLNNDPTSPDFNQKTGIQYSNYFELAYNTSVQDIDLSLFLGATLSKPEKANAATGFIGESGYYGENPGVVNLGVTASKSVKITTNYATSLTASLITNPQTKNVFLIFGISF
ncbi:hypothetical protein MNBD_BACTEROID07-103 [hydrothermal vent metagenome]|uniref:FrrB n=1 Tax=hydrothermal vent metagenome TaxID=652676 RepID=A0A3B0UVD1_9ZZZZ